MNIESKNDDKAKLGKKPSMVYAAHRKAREIDALNAKSPLKLAFVQGFVKRAASSGLTEAQALDILSQL